MTTLTVEIHPEAVDEAAAARRWYQERSHNAGNAFLAELDFSIRCIQDNPEIYPFYLCGTRRYLMRRFPYLIVYRLTQQSIQIIAIAHSRRRPGYWKTR